MRRQLLVSRFLSQTLTALLEDGRLATLRVERGGDGGAAGDILLGKVVRVVPGLNAAFVDVGGPQAAFLSADDAVVGHFGQSTLAPPAERTVPAARPQALPIQRLVQVGQRLVVQVRRAASGTKGPRVTSRIHLSGQKVVYMPCAGHLAISSRIADAAERERLSHALSGFVAEHGGVVARTASQGHAQEVLLAELSTLQGLWHRLGADAARDKRPRTLYAAPAEVPHAVTTLWTEDVARVDCDDAALAEHLASYIGERAPHRAASVHTFAPLAPTLSDHGPLDLFEAHGLSAAIAETCKKSVGLPSGGQLHIDVTEAMCVIDIDSRKFVGNASQQATMLALNLEAADEAARQLRLRNIGGIVVIDFVDLQSAEAREQVAARLRLALARDKATTIVLSMSELGLVQLTRRRQGASVHEALEAPCGHCRGRGRTRGAVDVARELFSAIRRSQRRHRGQRLLLNVAPDVAAVLWGEGREKLKTLGQEVGAELWPVTQEGWPTARFEVLNDAWPEELEAYHLL